MDGWKIKKDNKMKSYGDTNYDKKVIRINKKKSINNPMRKRPVNKGAHRYPDLLDTIKHEMLHVRHPKMTEKQVRKKALAWVKKATPKQKKRLYAKVK